MFSVFTLVNKFFTTFIHFFVTWKTEWKAFIHFCSLWITRWSGCTARWLYVRWKQLTYNTSDVMSRQTIVIPLCYMPTIISQSYKLLLRYLKPSGKQPTYLLFSKSRKSSGILFTNRVHTEKLSILFIPKNVHSEKNGKTCRHFWSFFHFFSLYPVWKR